MPSSLIIGFIAVIIIVSFIFSAISYSRQQALKKKKLMVKRFQQQADEALTYVSLLLKIDQSFELITQLQQLVVSALTSALRINPDDPMIQANLVTQRNKLAEYKSGHRNNKVACWVTSDAELTATTTQLGHLNRLLDLYRNKGDLSFAKHQEIQSHVQLIQQTLSTNSYLYQADLLGEQNNITSYQLYIKQAIQVIKKSNMDTDEKNKKIKELSDRIQEVKKTGKIGDLENFIKPKEQTPQNEESDEDLSA